MSDSPRIVSAQPILGNNILGSSLLLPDPSALMSAAGGATAYLLRDLFSTDRAAGAVNGTLAEPTGQTRTVTDTNNKLSITGQRADLATGGVAIGDPGLWYPSMLLQRGQMYIARVTNTGVGPSEGYFGWFNSATSNISNTIFFIANQIRSNGSLIIDAYVSGTQYDVAVIQRATGCWLFIKGGTFTNWTMLYLTTAGSGGEGTFPGFMAGSNLTIATADDVRVPPALYVPMPLAYDTFTRSNGALGSTEVAGPDAQVLTALAWAFTTGIWAVATNKAVGTPVPGADVIVNGAFAADSDWSKGTGWTIAAGVATGTTASSDLTQTVAPLTVGLWYRVIYTVSGFSAGTVQAVVGGNTLFVKGANGTYTEVIKPGTTAFLMRGAGFSGNLDNISAQALTTAELFASVVVSTADVLAEVAVTLPSATAGLPAGLVLNLDSTSSPANFIVCYLTGTGFCVLEECVAGTFTNKFTSAITYSAGAVLRVVRDGTSCRVFYNNAAVSTVQTMTANANARHGLFSTSASNSLDGFAVWARGTGNEYATLDLY